MIIRYRRNKNFKVCPKCGLKMKPEDRFCWNCGTDTDQEIVYESQYRWSRILLVIIIIMAIVAVMFLAALFVG